MRLGRPHDQLDDDHQQHTVDDELRRRHSDDRDHRSGGAQPRPRARRTSSTTSTHTVASHTHTHQPESTPHFLVKFRVGAGGTLTPPSVAIGGHATVYLSVSNASGGPLKLALRHGDKTVFTRTLPTGASTTKLPSLGNATYAVVLDGTPRGTLTIGAKAGP